MIAYICENCALLCDGSHHAGSRAYEHREASAGVGRKSTQGVAVCGTAVAAPHMNHSPSTCQIEPRGTGASEHPMDNV